MLAVLVLPHSNADTERVFSDLNDIKSWLRTQLTREALNALLQIRVNAWQFGISSGSSEPLPNQLVVDCFAAKQAYSRRMNAAARGAAGGSRSRAAAGASGGSASLQEEGGGGGSGHHSPMEEDQEGGIFEEEEEEEEERGAAGMLQGLREVIDVGSSSEDFEEGEPWVLPGEEEQEERELAGNE
jgi:hypothetical protein